MPYTAWKHMPQTCSSAENVSAEVVERVSLLAIVWGAESYAWSNLGVSLQLSEELSQAEEVFKRALSLATTQEAHVILSNLGILYRHQKKYQLAKAMFTKSLELKPGYAPAFNNMGLIFVTEGLLEEAKYCFEKALQSDPMLDAAKSNSIKMRL
ncbi:hypothetical protein KIW84_052847 [Lathyrus oleraceus]|uniref:Uncharacterized protein n=1 Tax=Pisum sativum TaxID=3888 RepID=A0A9D4WNQ2_PEA|nr:hypothetical protein KIW84_052847 [Pisum sativum]